MLDGEARITGTGLASWCRQLGSGEYHCDVGKITNLFHGKVVSVEDEVGPSNGGGSVQEAAGSCSSTFLVRVLAQTDTARFESFTNDQQHAIAVGVRDLYLASCRGCLTDEEKATLEGMTRIIRRPIMASQAQGMSISFHPSAGFKMLKFIANLDEFIPEQSLPYYAKVMNEPSLYAVFVDPAELSYHNFENIIPLDEWVSIKATLLTGEEETPPILSLTQSRKLSRKYNVWTCKLEGDGCQILQQVPKLDLYVPPLNEVSRGGERFIFHSNIFSKALTKAVNESDIVGQLARTTKTGAFAFVNPVFRCNKFTPGTGKFKSHRDTPYYDAVRSQVSKYSLLVYLSTGHGNPALRIGDVGFDSINEMTCVIFDQSLEHEGYPFNDADKIFIRTELVFTDRGLGRSERVASLFSEACYMTGHGIFDDEIARHAHECYERANSLHWALQTESAKASLHFHKVFGSVNFITNGYNYWFTKTSRVDIKQCAALAVLDYFNCKLNERPFRSICGSHVVRQAFQNNEEMWNYLEENREQGKGQVKKLQPLDYEDLLSRQQKRPFFKRDTPEWMEEGDLDDEEEEEEQGPGCCPFHAWKTFDAWESQYVLELYETCCEFTKRMVFGEPVTLLGEKVIINEAQIIVSGGKVALLGEKHSKGLPPVNFAACWNDTKPGHFIDVDQELGILQLLIPPIPFQESDRGYHLNLDFFRNDWMVQVDVDRKIPVPIITNDIHLDECNEEEGEGAFLSKVDTLKGYHFDYDGIQVEIGSWSSESGSRDHRQNEQESRSSTDSEATIEELRARKTEDGSEESDEPQRKRAKRGEDF